MARPIVDLEDLVEMTAMRLPLEPRALSQSSTARPRRVGLYGVPVWSFGAILLGDVRFRQGIPVDDDLTVRSRPRGPEHRTRMAVAPGDLDEFETQPIPLIGGSSHSSLDLCGRAAGGPLRDVPKSLLAMPRQGSGSFSTCGSRATVHRLTFRDASYWQHSRIWRKQAAMIDERGSQGKTVGALPARGRSRETSNG
jgi:hypothetical protein